MGIVFVRLCSVFLIIGVGWLARRRQLLDGNATHRLAHLLTACFYPSLIFSSIVRQFELDMLADHWTLPVGSFGIMVTGAVVGRVFIRFFGGTASPSGRAFHFQATMNNYSFLPMPLALFYWGEAGMARLVFSALGGEIAAWTLGVHALTGGRFSLASLRRMLGPPLVALLAALATIAVRDIFLAPTVNEALTGNAATLVAMWNAALDGLALLGQATIPVAMIVAGSRMAELNRKQAIGLTQLRMVGIRLILIPAIAMIWIRLLPLPQETTSVLALVAIMPVAVSSVMMCEIFGGDTEFAAAGVLSTHVASLVTIPLWAALVLL